MKSPNPLLLLLLLILLQLTLTAQVQWYQNQDGNNAPPYGTVAVSAQSLTKNSFVAAYLWSTNNDQNTWKIAKSHINGAEQRCFFITGVSSQVEFKVGHKNSIYVFERSFTPEFIPQYFVYKLDTNLNVLNQRAIEFPNGFSIFNVNAFELDLSDNLYFAGDGQYPDAGNLLPASFVMKANKNLITQWSRMDSAAASYTRVHINRQGFVGVINDYFTFYPDIKVKIFTPNGQYSFGATIKVDPARYSLYSILDEDENLLLYGGKMVNDTTQALYLSKISRWNGRVIYSKTLFASPSTTLLDLKLDKRGDVYSVVQQFFTDGSQFSKVSRINSHNGGIVWNKTFRYSHDSCNLFKLVLDESDRFYVVGEKRNNNVFSKGYSLRIKKNGWDDGSYTSPDSVGFQKSHWLSDGLADQNHQLIAIGSTQDLDPVTGANSYFRSFAVRFGKNNRCDGDERESAEAQGTPLAEIETNPKVMLYPNPVRDQLNISNLNPEEYQKLVVYNLQGALIAEQAIQGNYARVDVSKLTDGVYIVALRSSSMKKEKSMKFIIKRP
jgi:hypothetical protein